MVLLLWKMYQGWEYLEQYDDPRTRGYFISSRLGMALVAFLYFCLVKFGPHIMKNRKPLDLKTVIICYNAFQVVANAAVCIYALRLLPKMNWHCTRIDTSPTPDGLHHLNVTYYYAWLKILDLTDTLFFVLRKKDSHMTFLHCYHHGMMLLLGHVGVKYWPGGQGVYLAQANTFVHVVMYAYYLLTALDSSYGQTLWLKKGITIIQIIQHCFVGTMFLMTLITPNCEYPYFPAFAMVPQAMLMFILFSDFYYRAYIRKTRRH